jgi:hypothetical protein
MNKTVVKVFIAVVIALSLYGAYMRWRLNQLESELADVLVSKDSVSVLVDSSRAREASTSIQKDSLRDALEAANVLNGKLVAAAKIRLQPRTVTDTIVFPADSTITNFPFADTTEAGIFRGEMRVAPPPIFLQLGYDFIPAPLDVTVSLIQMRDKEAVFAVKYRGGETSIIAPFAKVPQRQKFLSTYVEGLFNPIDKNAALRAGVQAHTSYIPFLDKTNSFLILEGEEGFRSDGNNTSNLYIGIRKIF